MEEYRTFEEQWEQEERHALLARLRSERPQWARQRRVRHTIVATMAAVVLTFTIFSLRPSSITKEYDSVCCNRSNYADSHWSEVAAHVLARSIDF